MYRSFTPLVNFITERSWRWQNRRMWVSLHPTNISININTHTHIFKWNNSPRIPTKSWQKIFYTIKVIRMILIYPGWMRGKNKIWKGPAPLGGNCGREKVRSPWGPPSPAGRFTGSYRELQLSRICLKAGCKNWLPSQQGREGQHRYSLPYYHHTLPHRTCTS